MSPQPFPHLKPAEGLLWAAFLRDHAGEYTAFDYDVRVGRGHPTTPEQPDYIKRMIAALSPKRIDAVGWQGTRPTIFEVTPYGHRTLIGALVLYQQLYTEQYPTAVPPSLAAVVARVDPDAERLLAALGATTYRYPTILPG